MRPSSPPQTILLSEYTAPAFWVDTVDLTFDLEPKATKVTSKVVFRANTDRGSDGPHDLRLHGQELNLITASIDGKILDTDQILMDTEGLTIPHDLIPQDGFVWSCEVEINPQANTSLNGLYMSGGMYCTQCEAEGFRKITYYPDRPDVMAVFTVTVNGASPVLLSNGNHLGDGKWHDPWPKPAYLFALVAGDLVSYDDSFITQSGRNVELRIYVRPGDEGKCAYAMDALKRSMTWDEQTYGREYDLDLFMIVAVDDFNMGAMENKGLNIFNSKYVLASPETATDRDYEFIEGIIAHEYFHNWTGNRITCRDWFQLCLKEGLTVFRDQQFSGDMRSHAVKRIDDVLQLRGRQFREDAGPLAHPVRPEEYIEINNFYTATVYEKGAEVIGMLKLLVGDEGYKKSLDMYFDRHDGQACTIEDWITVFQDATGQDLTQFSLWYSQSGTPRVAVQEEFNDGTYALTLSQSNAPTPGQENKAPQVIPIRTGFLAPDGTEALPEELLTLTSPEQRFEFTGLTAKPTLSLLRGFSAPVNLIHIQPTEDLAFLLANDTDPFNKWEAGRRLATDLLKAMVLRGVSPDIVFLGAMAKVANDATLDPAFRALALSLPSEDSIAQAIFDDGDTPDPKKIYQQRNILAKAVATQIGSNLQTLYAAMKVPGAYSPDAGDAGKRALRAAVLGLITQLESDAATAKAQFSGADNMTEQLSALGILVRADQATKALATFQTQWSKDRLVMDKWFAVQASSTPPKGALERVKFLTAHKDFDWKNPNRYRSLIGVYAMNPAGFHRPDGDGYDFVADWLIKLDGLNPQTTARMCGVFETWKRYDTKRQAAMKAALGRIASADNLSKDTAEIVGKILNQD